jgi:hypothetical protein
MLHHNSSNLLSKKRNKTNSFTRTSKSKLSVSNSKITSFFTIQKQNNSHLSSNDKFINIKEEHNISLETLCYVNKILQQQQKRLKRHLNILDSFPLKIKYADLLERKLQLPIDYLKLIEQFKLLENEIDSSQNKQIKLKYIYQKVIKLLVKIWPDGYIIDKYNDTISKPMNSGSIEDRVKGLKDKLIDIVKIYHDIFIKQYGISFPSPVIVGTWHSMFNVEDCPSLK